MLAAQLEKNKINFPQITLVQFGLNESWQLGKPLLIVG